MFVPTSEAAQQAEARPRRTATARQAPGLPALTHSAHGDWARGYARPTGRWPEAISARLGSLCRRLGRAALVAVCLLACWPGAAENLLANSGFEEVTGTQPARWDLFIAPKEGAFGRLSEDAYDGEHAVMLHTPTPYAREPVNNWSQNILRDLGGARLRVSGWVKVRDAGEAALWLQCWRRTPWGLTASATSADAAPVYGTADWRRVQFEVDVPETTDFLTCRCVLKGTGTAWFDHVSVHKGEEEEVETKAAAGAEKAAEKRAVAHPGRYKAKAPAVEDGPPTRRRDRVTRQELERSAEPDAGADPLSAPLAAARLRRQIANLEETNLLMAGELERLRDERLALTEELLELTMQLEQLRDQVNALQGEGRPGSQAPGSQAEYPYPVPPLVPHGEDWRKYR